jgi:hypothetical protein
MPPKGGFRQRILAQQAANVEDGVPQAGGIAAPPLLLGGGVLPVAGGVEHSELASLLLQLWGWGSLSGPTIQALAAAAVHDGLTSAPLRRIAELGTGGACQGNIARDIGRHCFGDVSPPPLYSVQVPAMQHNVQVQAEAQLLLPHQMFASVAEHCPDVFASWHRELPGFWAAAANDPAIHGDHPMKANPRWRRRAIPLLVYGDGARMTRLDSFEIAVWSPLLAKSSTWSSRFIMGGWISGAQVKGEAGSWEVIWSVPLWRTTEHTNTPISKPQASNVFSHVEHLWFSVNV